MPKISTTNVRIDTEAGYVNYSITVNYTTTHGFYIPIPEEFSHIFDMAPEEQQKEYGLKNIRRGKYNNGDLICRAVAGESENQALQFFRAAVTYFATNTVQCRPVIIVTFNREGRPGKTDHGGMSFEDIGIKMGIDYAVEHKIGDKVKFLQEYKTHGNYDVQNLVRIKDRWGSEISIIDDTPANREYLERIYGALGQLQEQLMKLGKSDVLLAAIAEGQKLLVNA